MTALGCERRSLSTSKDKSPVLVSVNGTSLTKREFDFFLPEEYRDILTPRERMEYLERWIVTQLLYTEAMNSGAGISPEIAARLEQYKKDLIADQLVQKVIEEKAFVSEEEIRAFYEAHKDEYQKEFRVSHILVNTLEEAENVKAQLGSRSFTFLARKYSIDKHSGAGGDLGYLSKGNMIPEFEDVVFSMKPGDVSDIIESEFGYHIIKMSNVRNARVKFEYEDVQGEITNELTLNKRQTAYEDLVRRLRSTADIQFHDDSMRLVGITGLDTLLKTD